MENVLLVIHLIIALAMVLLILIQRTAQDGGGLLGGGGGGTMGGMFTARGSANVLSRTTAILAGLFIITSLLLTMIASHGHKQDRSLVSQIPALEKAAPATPGDAAQAQPEASKAAAPVPAQPPAVPLSK